MSGAAAADACNASLLLLLLSSDRLSVFLLRLAAAADDDDAPISVAVASQLWPQQSLEFVECSATAGGEAPRL